MLTARRPNPTFECRRYCLEAGSNEVSRLSQCPEDGAKVLEGGGEGLSLPVLGLSI
jgi:hypothetical protein